MKHPKCVQRAMARFEKHGVTTIAALTVAIGAAVVPATASAQAFPSKAVHIVVPFPPGGSTDLLARRIGEKLSASLKQPVIVENRPGAGGTVGADHVVKSTADGHTLLFGVTGSNAIAAALYPKLPYDPVKDFAPVTMVAVSPLILAANKDVPVKTLGEFVELAKSKPGSVSHGSPGNGTSMHLTGEMFELATGTELLHVPYRGSAAALTDLLGGQISAMFSDVIVLMPMVQSNKVTPLAVSSPKRHPMLPNVPTIAESGYAGFEALSWQGLFAPAGTPPEVVKLLSEEVNKAIRSPDIQDYFGSRGFILEGTTPEEFKRYIEKEVAKWTEIVRKSGVKLN